MGNAAVGWCKHTAHAEKERAQRQMSHNTKAIHRQGIQRLGSELLDYCEAQAIIFLPRGIHHGLRNALGPAIGVGDRRTWRSGFQFDTPFTLPQFKVQLVGGDLRQYRVVHRMGSDFETLAMQLTHLIPSHETVQFFIFREIDRGLSSMLQVGLERIPGGFLALLSQTLSQLRSLPFVRRHGNAAPVGCGDNGIWPTQQAEHDFCSP
jgi:hypothetical protein